MFWQRWIDEQSNLHPKWIAVAVAEKIGVVETAAEFFKKRTGKATGARLMDFLHHAPDVEPEEDDQVRPSMPESNLE